MLPNFSDGHDSEKGIWQFQEAKAKFSEVLNRADQSGRQFIVHNKKHFVILSAEVYNDYIGANKSILDVFLRCPHPDVDLDITRLKETLRDIES